MTLRLTQREFDALFPPPPAAEESKPPIPAQAALRLAAMPPGGSHAYRIVEALLRVSEAVYGGAVLRHDALARTWDLRTSAETGVRVSREPAATVITPYSRVRGRWRPMRSQRYPPLSLPELGRLFFWRNP